MNYDKVLKYGEQARAVYGTGAGTPPLNTAQYSVVPVLDFKQTSPDFQAALYRDPSTGKYRIAVAGTDDLKGDLSADLALATQDIATAADKFSSSWHPEMTDAVNFAFEAFKEIRDDLTRKLGREPTLNQIRAEVDVTGHSLGGALAELIGKFFGLPGCNIDGPGVTALVGKSEFAALQDKVRAEFSDLQSNYQLPPGQFTANAFSVVGMAGTHLPDVEFDATATAQLSYPGSLALAASSVVDGPLGVGAGLVLAGADAGLHHPLGGIIARIEQQQGLRPAGDLPTVDFGALVNDPHVELFQYAPGATNYAHALTWLSAAANEPWRRAA